ncbi:hypothetical protein IIS_05166 [Bacillus cereus VD131]|nr:hypothetical protein IIS_05166 [Bacillus cereus VD131]MCS3599217.1 preprotein translocase subunit SecE [Bacillus sp. JUb91]
MSESTFSYLMILVVVICLAGFVYLMDWTVSYFIKGE